MTKTILITAFVAAIIAFSAIGVYSVTTPSLLNGYKTDYVDTQGVRHISIGDPSQDNLLYHGLVTYTAKHANGAVFAIIQDHNTRTVTGINCAENVLFNGLSPAPVATNGTTGSNDCRTMLFTSSAHFNGFRFIGLMNQSTVGANANNIILNGSDTVATSKLGGTRMSTGHGIIFTASQGLPVNSTVAGTSTYNKITITSTAIAFTGDGASGTNICGAALLNSTSSTTNAMFAEQSFSCLLLANSDTLTVTWAITVS